jgi:cell division protein FtsL
MAATAAASRRSVVSPPPPTLVKARARTKTTATHRSQPRTRRAATRPAARPAAARRRSAPRRVSHPITPLTPFAAVGRTAVAVTTLPDSGLVVRMTRGRLWIGVLGALLTGIVALNVLNLSLSSSSSRATEQATQLEQENSALRAQIAEQLSNERVQAAATRLGMIVPDPGDIAYLNAGPNDAANAARRLRAGVLSATIAPAAFTQPAATSTPAPATSTTTGAATAPSPQPATQQPSTTSTQAPPAGAAPAPASHPTQQATAPSSGGSAGGITAN